LALIVSRQAARADACRAAPLLRRPSRVGRFQIATTDSPALAPVSPSRPFPPLSLPSCTLRSPRPSAAPPPNRATNRRLRIGVSCARAVRSSETLNPITCVHRGQIRLYSCAANSRATALRPAARRDPLGARAGVCIHARVHRTGRLCARGFGCFWQRARKAPATAFIGAAGSFYSAIAAGDARSATLYMARARIFPVYAQREIKSRHRPPSNERERERERGTEGASNVYARAPTALHLANYCIINITALLPTGKCANRNTLFFFSIQIIRD